MSSRDGTHATCHLTRYLDHLSRAATALSRSPHDAEDLVQETYARVLARPRAIRRRDDPRYLIRALRNTWIDMQRARAARPSAGGADALSWIAEHRPDPVELTFCAREVLDAIGALSPKLREAVVAVDLLGLSYDEAARALSIPHGTLRSRLARGRHAAARRTGP
jgi:RNA polymerase sigma-70 factor (ECF subfamily)